jgi:NAD(P)-dependent dehydrogenase (short-subunit alcohol dehydrogenase family)
VTTTSTTKKADQPQAAASRMTVLVVGATGSIGHLVVEEAARQGCTVRALVRNPGKACELPAQAQGVVGDVTRPETLSDAVDGVDAVVFTLGSDGAGKVGAENVNYGGIRVWLGLGDVRRPGRYRRRRCGSPLRRAD